MSLEDIINGPNEMEKNITLFNYPSWLYLNLS